MGAQTPDNSVRQPYRCRTCESGHDPHQPHQYGEQVLGRVGKFTWHRLLRLIGPNGLEATGAMWAVLYQIEFEAREDGTGIRPGNANLHEWTGIASKTTLANALKTLVDLGLLHKMYDGRSAGRNGGRGQATVYELTMRREHVQLLEAAGFYVNWVMPERGAKYIHASQAPVNGVQPSGPHSLNGVHSDVNGVQPTGPLQAGSSKKFSASARNDEHSRKGNSTPRSLLDRLNGHLAVKLTEEEFAAVQQAVAAAPDVTNAEKIMGSWIRDGVVAERVEEERRKLAENREQPDAAAAEGSPAAVSEDDVSAAVRAWTEGFRDAVRPEPLKSELRGARRYARELLEAGRDPDMVADAARNAGQKGSANLAAAYRALEPREVVYRSVY